ncbi:hypothetical protein ABT061_44855 [Streptosporangium sp. NPDC002544]|uniref:hypothetical protein n=1 Tax=Streptosporangium sp. NPDC002544 TaxID=3154538 RepID=UPI00331A08DE
MTYTEEELRAALAERVLGGPPDVQRIVRRGRRIRRRRIAVGTMLTGAAATAVSLLILGPRSGDEVTAEMPLAVGAPLTAATRSPSPGLPPENRTSAGSAPLIKKHASQTMVTGTAVTFQPLSPYTSYKLVCADQKAYAVIQAPGGGRSAGRCGKGGLSGSYDKQSVTSDWLKRPQRFKVWVLPEPSVGGSGRAGSGKGCERVRKEVGLCDGRYVMKKLLEPGVVERLAAEIGPQPGRWAFGIYDRAGATAPPQPTPTITVTIKPKK